MATIPEELQRLWSERDRNRKNSRELPTITLEDTDSTDSTDSTDDTDGISGGVILDALPDSFLEEQENGVLRGSDVPSPIPLIPPILPILPSHSVLENIRCFPAHTVTSNIDIAKYESHYERSNR
jgi:hypothetical protein